MSVLFLVKAKLQIFQQDWLNMNWLIGLDGRVNIFGMCWERYQLKEEIGIDGLRKWMELVIVPIKVMLVVSCVSVIIAVTFKCVACHQECLKKI